MRGLPGCRACSRNCRVVFTSISSSVNPIAALELELSRVQRPSAEGTSRFLPPKSPTSPFPPSVASVAALICAGVGFATSNILYRLQNTADTDRNQPEALKGADGQLGGSIRGRECGDLTSAHAFPGNFPIPFGSSPRASQRSSAVFRCSALYVVRARE